MGAEESRGAYDRNFVPLDVGTHFILVGSFQQVDLGDGCYECGELGNFVRYCRRVLVLLTRVGPEFGRGSQDSSSHSSSRVSDYMSCYDCGEVNHLSRDCPRRELSTQKLSASINPKLGLLELVVTMESLAISLKHVTGVGPI